MGALPVVLVVLAAHNTLLSQRFIKLSGLVCLCEDVLRVARLSAILVGRSSELLSRASNATEVGDSGIIRRHVNHAERRKRDGVDASRNGGLVDARTVGIYNVGVRHGSQGSRVGAGFGSRCFSLLGSTRSLFSSCIFFGKALASRFGFPVIVANSSSVGNDATSKLAEHGPCCYNSDLPRTVRVWQNLLLNEVVLLRLVGDDLIQRSVLVEEQVRVTVA